MDLRKYTSVKERRIALEKALGIHLDAIGQSLVDEAIASTKNCENMIGAVGIPVGIAGPVPVQMTFQNEEYQEHQIYVPLATTEGALVASVNRGCGVIRESGGASVVIESVGVTRGPVFRVKSIQEGIHVEHWLYEHVRELSDMAKTSSSHISLLKIDVQIVGVFVYVRLYFDTQDAMGMNMVTIATEKISIAICETLHISLVAVAGNYDTDKKPAWLNVINGRGKRVLAEMIIPRKVVEEKLHTTPEKIYEVWVAKCMVGSAIAGSMGFNAHMGNIVAALFLATGQDPAHITEGSMGITTTELIPREEGVGCVDLHFSITLPDVMVGTVGGGTGLSTQKEALSILGIIGGNEGRNALELAGILGVAVLAGELSLLGSLAEGSLGKAHQTLARGK